MFSSNSIGVFFNKNNVSLRDMSLPDAKKGNSCLPQTSNRSYTPPEMRPVFWAKKQKFVFHIGTAALPERGDSHCS